MDEFDNILDLNEERERRNCKSFYADDCNIRRHELVRDPGLVCKIWSVLAQLPER